MYLLAAFIAVPLIEIALFIQVGGFIGLWPTLLIVLLTAIAGTVLVRSQGAQVLAELRGALSDLGDPTEPLAHGAMILFSGALLLTPGFFTDAVGFALLVPGVRRFVTRQVKARIKVSGMAGMHGGGPRGPGAAAPGPDPHRPSDPHRHPPRHAGHAGTTGANDGDVIDADYTELPESKRPTHRPSGWTRH